MDLSGLKWPLILVVIVGVGWLGTKGGVAWMYGKFTEATPGVDLDQDLRDEAGLTRLGGYTFHLWQWERTIDILETAINRYGENAPNYWYNMERLASCYDRVGEFQISYDILQELMRANAHEIDDRVPNFDALNLRANKLKEMYELN